MRKTLISVFLFLTLISSSFGSISEFLSQDDLKIVYGDSKEEDLFNSLVLAGILGFENDESLKEFPEVISDNKEFLEDKIISVGGSCANQISAKYLRNESLECGNWDYSKGESFVKLYDDRVLVVAGTTKEDTLRAIRGLKRFKENTFLRDSEEVGFSRYTNIAETFEKLIQDHLSYDNVEIVYGDDGTDSDLTNALLIGEFLYEKQAKQGKFPSIHNTNYFNDRGNKNLILIGGPCSNSQFDDLVNDLKYECLGWGLSPDKKVIKAIEDNGRVVLFLAGNTKEDTEELVRKLIDYKNIPSFYEKNYYSVADEIQKLDEEESCGFLCGLKERFVEKGEEGNIEIDSDSEALEFSAFSEFQNENCYDCFLENQANNYIADMLRVYGRVKPETSFMEADRRYILGKLTKNRDIVCSSIEFYEEALNEVQTSEDELIIMENILFLAYDCLDQRDQHKYLSQVISLSKEVGYPWKGEIYERAFRDNHVSINVEDNNIERKLDVPKNAMKYTLGKSKIEVTSDDKVGVQVERVVRDWFSFNIKNFPNYGPNGTGTNDSPIEYMEGSILTSIVEATDADVVALPNVLVVSKLSVPRTKWYAVNAEGKFQFEVLPDKVQYLTSKCIKNVCLFQDSHGISALAAKAIKKNATLVLGCGDWTGKMHGAYYLAQRGVNVLYPTDRYASEMIGYVGEGVALGSAPVRAEGDKIIIGDQPVSFGVNEKIVVQTTYKKYPAQYYDAPYKYFKKLEKVSGVNLNLDVVNTPDIKLTYKVIDRAREIDANIVAIRVGYDEDYEPVRSWLAESGEHRAILFHSSAYPAGMRILTEFPEQTTFGDPRPIFE